MYFYNLLGIFCTFEGFKQWKVLRITLNCRLIKINQRNGKIKIIIFFSLKEWIFKVKIANLHIKLNKEKSPIYKNK